MKNLIAYILIILLVVNCKETEYKQKNIEIPELPKTSYTFEEFLSHFKEAELPFTFPEDEWYDKYSKAIGVEFYDTFVVGKLFGEVPNTAYAFYAKINYDKFIPIIIVQERKTGSFFWLFTINNKSYEVIDSAMIAFKRVSETELDIQKATIYKNLTIKAKRELNITIIPEDKEKLVKQGIKTEKKHFYYSWKINSEGKIEKVSSS